MAKKKLTSTFLLLNEVDELVGFYANQDDAFEAAKRDEIDQAKILEIVNAWQVYYPEEPDPELCELKLEDL